jgi:hypothetical protein
LTWLIFLLGLLLPIVVILAAPSFRSMRRLAYVDQQPSRRVFVSRQLLVVDVNGRAEMPTLQGQLDQQQSELYNLWWQRQPMRTDDDFRAVRELDVSPVSIVQKKDWQTAIKNKPARMKARQPTRGHEEKVGPSHAEPAGDVL